MTPRSIPALTIAQIAAPIQTYTRSWMLAPDTNAYGVGLGFASGAQFWVVGRAGVIGECPASVAGSAIAFEPQDAVDSAWSSLPEGLTYRGVAAEYRDRITTWGEGAFSSVPAETLEAVDTLSRRVIDAAPSALGVLFAGWRALPIPLSTSGRAALTLHVLREMRGAAHIAAVTACGLTPLDAILAATHAPPRTGTAYAQRLGFNPPFRDPDEVRPQREKAERLTESALVPYFSVLTDGELLSLGAAITSVCGAGLEWGQASGLAFQHA